MSQNLADIQGPDWGQVVHVHLASYPHSKFRLSLDKTCCRSEYFPLRITERTEVGYPFYLKVSGGAASVQWTKDSEHPNTFWRSMLHA